MVDLMQLNKLEKYLKDNGYVYERIDRYEGDTFHDRHQLNVYEGRMKNGAFGRFLWDAICHFGSYGYEDGLLEIYGNIVDPKKDGDTVVGHLTAADVIKRLEK